MEKEETVHVKHTSADICKVHDVRAFFIIHFQLMTCRQGVGGLRIPSNQLGVVSEKLSL